MNELHRQDRRTVVAAVDQPRRSVAVGNYGKGFSLVLRRREIPPHTIEERLEIVVCRLSNPEQKFKLYAWDNHARDVHFVATRLGPVKNEKFLIDSIRAVGLVEVVEEYNQNKPAGLGNTQLVLNQDGLIMNIESESVNIGQGKLEAYGTQLAVVAAYPSEFPMGKSERMKLLIVKDHAGFHVRLTKGRSITSIGRAAGKIIVAIEDAHRGDDRLEGFKGRRGNEIRLGKIEDRGWLGGLAVGEGSFFTRSSKTSPSLEPCLEIAMQDEDAIDKAAGLMGIRKTRGQFSESSGRPSWCVKAVGARMIDILELIRPFLTPPKINQAETAIRQAQESGFLTKKEMREARKEDIIEELQRRPGSSTRELGIRLCTGYSYARQYLGELEQEGRVYGVAAGTLHRPRLNWFIGQDPSPGGAKLSTVGPGLSKSS